ncbi:hypothetical protein BN3660_02563 [Eubacteriaceae bacterium CHKCI004]|nr:hypothetical protein BN3660_02563 [Eubacteriaceae bacterium CHKCI004]
MEYICVFPTGQDAFLSKIQCGMFKGNTRAVFVDKRDYGGPLWQQVEESFRFVLRNIRLGAKIEGVYRKDIYELPPDSIRELIINAVINCSFLQTSHVQVAIYDDRLEITSPGGLMPGVTVGRMKEGYSQIRNRALAHAFSYMNLIEGWGTGIPRLMQEMKEYGLSEPEFLDMEIALRINLYRSVNVEHGGAGERLNGSKKVPDSMEKMPDSAGDVPDKLKKVPDSARDVPDPSKESANNIKEMSYQQKIIYHAIAEKEEITSAEVSQLLGVKQRRARVILKDMVDSGIIRRIGAAGSTKYIL